MEWVHNHFLDNLMPFSPMTISLIVLSITPTSDVRIPGATCMVAGESVEMEALSE